jgi:hypothetical protein
MYKSIILLVLVFILSGCEQVTDRVLRDYNLSFEPKTLDIKRGETKEVKLFINVTTGFDIIAEETAVTVYRKPAFATVVTEAIIPGGLNDGLLQVTVAADAPLGKDKITIQTNKAELGRRGDLEINVLE